MGKINLKPVVSYTTRNKRIGEVEGREHYFINPNQAEIILKTENILAYTKIGDIEYFATLESLNGSNLYIIDPKGIEYIKSKFPDLNYKVVYIHTSTECRMNRAKERDSKDFFEAFEKRNNSEDEQFTNFENNNQWDLLLENNDNCFEYCVNKFIRFVKDTSLDKSNKDRPLYLIAGRSGSGKDSICREAIRYFKEN